ncbi:MAG: hypothetical protein HY854_21810 [Burkholderiales bacterium]|nr:hypothetical protein [Burkholderiales bacterium]
MNKTLLTAALLAACGCAFAKLPPPVLDDAAKAKAAETAAKTAWQAKMDGFLLCKAQDRVVAKLGKSPAKAMPVAAKPASAAVPPAAAASGTPAVAAAPPPCADPGPFAYNPPEQKPLETSGAHSPSGTAASPPSVKKPSAEMAPGGKKS